jgi:hypothetical protein
MANKTISYIAGAVVVLAGLSAASPAMAEANFGTVWKRC